MFKVDQENQGSDKVSAKVALADTFLISNHFIIIYASVPMKNFDIFYREGDLGHISW